MHKKVRIFIFLDKRVQNCTLFGEKGFIPHVFWKLAAFFTLLGQNSCIFHTFEEKLSFLDKKCLVFWTKSAPFWDFAVTPRPLACRRNQGRLENRTGAGGAGRSFKFVPS
jgi:hypothetical protein